MWKISVIVREDVDLDQPITFTEVVNVKKTLSLGKSYLGNAHYAVGISHLTRRELIEIDFGKLVQMIRDFTDMHNQREVF